MCAAWLRSDTMECLMCKAVSRKGWTKADFVFLLVIVASIVTVVLLKSNGSAAPTPELFAQHVSLPAASQESAETGKPVLVLATASWCGPCQAFKRGALSDPEVAKVITDNAIPVYLDIDEHPEAASMFGVQSIPTLLLLKDGMVVDRAGKMSSARTIEWVNAAVKKSAANSAG
jgi:thioredoxin 1